MDGRHEQKMNSDSQQHAVPKSAGPLYGSQQGMPETSDTKSYTSKGWLHKFRSRFGLQNKGITIEKKLAFTLTTFITTS